MLSAVPSALVSPIATPPLMGVVLTMLLAILIVLMSPMQMMLPVYEDARSPAMAGVACDNLGAETGERKDRHAGSYLDCAGVTKNNATVDTGEGNDAVSGLACKHLMLINSVTRVEMSLQQHDYQYQYTTVYSHGGV